MPKDNKNKNMDQNNMGGSRTATKNPVEVQAFLGGIDYPADKQMIVDHAREQDAPMEVIDALEQLPDHEYRTASEVSKEVARSK